MTQPGILATPGGEDRGRSASDALTLDELVVDVRRTRHALTAEAMTAATAGANLCLHAHPETDPRELVSDLIDAAGRLGVRALRYRVVREDLPPQVPVEYRHAS